MKVIGRNCRLIVVKEGIYRKRQFRRVQQCQNIVSFDIQINCSLIDPTTLGVGNKLQFPGLFFLYCFSNIYIYIYICTVLQHDQRIYIPTKATREIEKYVPVTTTVLKRRGAKCGEKMSWDQKGNF